MKGTAAALLVTLYLAGCGGSSSTTETSSSVASATTTASVRSTSTRSAAHVAARRRIRRTHPRLACPASSTVLVGVYHPYRLHVLDSCRHISGTVVTVTPEEDGDLHFDVRLDGPYRAMLMANNLREQHGALVVELMPRDHGHLPAPGVGDRVSMTGAYVDDVDHDWAELHPVWTLSIDGAPAHTSGPRYGGSPSGASSATAVESCHTNTGALCTGYGGSEPARPGGETTRTSRTSPAPVTSTQIVHPGAFCSPQGARGVTSAGTPMTCRPSATDARLRWRRS